MSESPATDGVKLWSRRGNLLTAQFPAIAQAFAELSQGTVVDGEIVALDEKGLTSFNLLQHHRSQASAIRYYLFDLLSDRGKSWLDVPLVDRRVALATKVRASLRHPLSISETIDAPGAQLIRAAKALGLEGVIAKHKDSSYEPGRRSGAWIKYKINKGQEFVIGGYTPGNPFDAVIVGYYDGDKLLFASKVRAGFVPHVRRELMAKMKPLKTDGCPVRQPTRETPHAAGVDPRANQRLCLAQTRARRSDRVYRVDTRRPPTPCGLRRPATR